MFIVSLVRIVNLNTVVKHLGTFRVRLKEHKRDLRIGNSNKALLSHISQSNHNFDFNTAKILIYNKSLRRTFEAAAIAFFNYLYIYIYIYIYRHPQTDCFVVSHLFSVARQTRFLKLGSKQGRLKRQSKILTLSHEEISASKGSLNAYVSNLF